MGKIKSILLNELEMSKILTRISHEIIESQSEISSIAIIGIRTRGEIFAKKIVDNIDKISGDRVDYGVLDVTFYRDDFSQNLGSPKVGPSDISFDINSKNIVLIDDVLYTGRTIRAAMDELFSFGRAASIKLGVLIDRGHRELPIKADFVGKNCPTSNNEHVHVLVNEVDGEDEVRLVQY